MFTFLNPINAIICQSNICLICPEKKISLTSPVDKYNLRLHVLKVRIIGGLEINRSVCQKSVSKLCTGRIEDM